MTDRQILILYHGSWLGISTVTPLLLYSVMQTWPARIVMVVWTLGMVSLFLRQMDRMDPPFELDLLRSSPVLMKMALIYFRIGAIMFPILVVGLLFADVPLLIKAIFTVAGLGVAGLGFAHHLWHRRHGHA